MRYRFSLPRSTRLTTSVCEAHHVANSIYAKMLLTTGVSLMLLLALLSCPQLTVAQEKFMTTTDAEKDRLTKELEIAKLKTAIAEERQKRLEALKSTTTTTALNGELKADDKVVMESQTLAYQAMSEIASKIRHRISNEVKGVKTLVVHNQSDVAAILYYQTLSNQIEVLKADYKANSTALNAALNAATGQGSGMEVVPLAAGIGLATNAVTAGLDLLSLFRTDVDLKGTKFTIDEEALVAEVARNFKEHDSTIKVLYPKMYNLPPGDTALDKSELLNSLKELYQEDAKSKSLLVRVEALTDAQKKAVQAPADLLKSSVKRFGDLIAQLTTFDSETSTTALTTLMRAERLRNILRGAEGGRVLYLKVIDAGGTNRIKRNRFFLTDRLSHSGAAIINYMVFDTDGTIMVSKVLYKHIGFTKFKSPTGAPESSNFDVKDGGK